MPTPADVEPAVLHKIIYASRASWFMTQPDLEDLLQVARARNEQCHVTGLLLYAHGSFLQVLEGEESATEEIYASIARDHRHGDIRLLARDVIGRRRFAGWAMGFDHLDDATLTERLPGFVPATEFPLVNAGLIHNAVVAETMLDLYARNV